MDSEDEEEMANLRASARHAGGRAVSSAAGTASVSGASLSKQQPNKRQEQDDSDADQEDAGAANGRGVQGGRSRLPHVGTGRCDESDDEANGKAVAADAEVDALAGETKKLMARGLPVHFGPRRSAAGSQSTAKHTASKAAGTSAAGAVASTKPPETALGVVPGSSSPAVPEASAMEISFVGSDDADMPLPGKEKEALPVSHEVSIPAVEKMVTAVTVDPKAARMVVGGMDGHLSFFDFGGMNEKKESFRYVEPVEGHMIQAVSFSTTGGAVLVVASDSHARIYDKDGSSKLLQSTVKGDMYVRDVSQTKGHTQTLTDGLWHPFSRENFITSALDGTVRIWDLNATPVGMDQVLPSIHVLKCVDKRNVCVGGGSGRGGGLHPTCCAMSPIDGMIVGGCTDGSFQVFNQKPRYLRPDKIIREAHKAQVTCVSFLSESGNKRYLATRSMDGTMKIWDCRMLSDARGPVHTFENLSCALEKTGVCGSPDGKHVVTGTSFTKGTAESASLLLYSTKDFRQVQAVDLGKRSITSLSWPKALNQIVVGTSSGEVVMMYSPFSSTGGALHFVGKRAKKKMSHEIDGTVTGPIFNMTDPGDIKKFYSTGHGNMMAIRRAEARHQQKTIVPEKPPAKDDGIHTATSLFVSHVISKDKKKRAEEDQDIQKALLAQQDAADKDLLGRAYRGNQPEKILDYTVDVSEGDKRMQLAAKGDFCRKCGQKICRCVDYSIYGQAAKKPKLA